MAGPPLQEKTRRYVRGRRFKQTGSEKIQQDFKVGVISIEKDAALGVACHGKHPPKEHGKETVGELCKRRTCRCHLFASDIQNNDVTVGRMSLLWGKEQGGSDSEKEAGVLGKGVGDREAQGI